MPLGGAGPAWFVVGGVVALGIALMAGLAQPWSSPSGSRRVDVGGVGGGGGTEVIEAGVALGDSSIAGVTEWRGELVAITGAGVVVRSPDARRWEKVPATGFTPPERDVRDGEDCAGDKVRGVAARNGVLVAAGQRAVPPEPGDDYCDARVKLWRSNDATTWDSYEPSGLAETDRVDAVVTDATGFLAFGVHASRIAKRVNHRDAASPSGVRTTE